MPFVSLPLLFKRDPSKRENESCIKILFQTILPEKRNKYLNWTTDLRHVVQLNCLLTKVSIITINGSIWFYNLILVYFCPMLETRWFCFCEQITNRTQNLSGAWVTPWLWFQKVSFRTNFSVSISCILYKFYLRNARRESLVQKENSTSMFKPNRFRTNIWYV